MILEISASFLLDVRLLMGEIFFLAVDVERMNCHDVFNLLWNG